MSTYVAAPLDVSDSLIVDAVSRIHRCRGGEEVAKEVLHVLAEAFGFHSLMLGTRAERAGETLIEWKYCAGKWPSDLLGTVNTPLLSEEARDEDILSHTCREGEIVRIDPGDTTDPLYHQIHAETWDRFGMSDPVYFIPFRGRDREVQGVICASLPRSQGRVLAPEFRRVLDTVANHIGIAIENAELHVRLDRVAKQRELLLAIAARVDAAESMDEKFFIILTGVTCAKGLGFNRAFLFLRDQYGRYSGVWGIAPEDRKHWEKIDREFCSWELDRYLQQYDPNSTPDLWPTVQIREVTLSLRPGTPCKECLDSKNAAILSGSCPMDPAFRPFYISRKSYALVPIVVGSTCDGVLYLDNCFSGEEISSLDVTLLEELGERIGNLLQVARQKEQRERTLTALADLVKRVESLVSGGEAQPDSLYLALLDAAGILGAARACIVRRMSSGGEWTLVKASTDWPLHDEFWREAVDALTSSSFGHGEGIPYTSPEGPNQRRQLILAFLPTRPGEAQCALCVEPAMGMAIDDPIVYKAIGTLASFASAILDASSQAYTAVAVAEGFVERPGETFAAEFARLTAHQSKNVLNDIILSFQNFRERGGYDSLSKFERRKLDALKHQVDMGRQAIVSYMDLLDHIRQRETPEQSWTKIAPVARSTRRLLSPSLASRALEPNETVVINVPDDLEVKTDYTTLTIIIHNLLSNAIKAVRDTHKPLVEIKASTPDKGRIRIKVIDNGCGIMADERSKIFQPGYSGFSKRVPLMESSGTPRTKSSGIRLSQVKRIIEEKHGGSLTVNTSSGKTTAEVILSGRRIA